MFMQCCVFARGTWVGRTIESRIAQGPDPSSRWSHEDSADPEAVAPDDQGTLMASRRLLLAVFASVMLVALAIVYGVQTGLIDPDYTVTRDASSEGNNQ